MENENLLTGHEGSNLRHDENLAFLREGKGGLTIGSSYFGTEEQYRLAHGLDPEPSTKDAEASHLNESEPLQHENAILSLSPGSALFVPTDNEPATGDSLFGATSAAHGLHGHWVAPGDFRLFLQPGESGTDSDGLVREIIAGAYRKPEDGDFEHPVGTFVPDSEWDDVVGAVHRECLQLRELIGELPEGAHPDEIKPRAASFMAERTNWETEVAALRASESELRTTVADLTARNAELLTASVATGLPADAREKLIGIKGVSEKLADEILSVLASTASTN